MQSLSRRKFTKLSATVVTGTVLTGFSGCNNTKPKLDLRKIPITQRVIDAHVHVVPETVDRCLQVMDENYIRFGMNIGVKGVKFKEYMSSISGLRNRMGAMYAFDWDLWKTDPNFPEKAPDLLEQAVENGALGVKNFKDLGLTVTDNNGEVVKIDDPRLMPIWERAQQLKTIVAFHTTDPLPFFQPWTPENERWAELELHPEWSFADRSKYSGRSSILEQRNNVIKSFKELTFQCVHVANNAQDVSVVDKWMDEMPNIVLDTSARIGELGRLPVADGYNFFEKHQDRIMFGTDRMFWKNGEVQGAGPTKAFTKEEDNIFYESHWRYLQTKDKQFDHPTPIQGDWKINGIGLPEGVLKKVYWDNAYKLYNLKKFKVQ